MPDKQKNDNVEITLERVRGSYLNLFKMKAQTFDDGTTSDPKFSGTFILSKEHDAKQIKAVEAAIDRVIREKWKGKVTRKGLKGVCLRDGEEKGDKDGYGPDIMFVSASTDRRFPIVDAKFIPIQEEDGTVYSGCYLDVRLRLWAQDNNWGKRINAEICAVRLNNRDPEGNPGEPFGGGQPTDPKAVFKPLDDDEGGESNDWE